ncbi:amino acid permease [candidate division CSSED10-310 bacterium]|uniref:Amino acid permease n=1 Tax=candidate division CSSED10-310 bacterium TaxID=2855610 RepID=A0ABV6YR70_UNCC1
MGKSKQKKGHGFGTGPVFLAAISTILGAILFLRFSYAVGHAGPLGTILIIVIGHCITIPTAFAIAEIATNLKVEGGGEYFIISRSFGATIGGTIGISLYLSQAISVAFYMIAFAESFRPLFPWLEHKYGFYAEAWMISLPATLLLLLLILFKGAQLGVKVLWVVVSTMSVALTMFFLGSANSPPASWDLFATINKPDNFFIVFAIIFPAFTGMTAGVGLSGDLRNPRRSIPLGTLSATIAGMVVYILVVLKMASSLSPGELAADQFAMSKIAIWGPIIPIGLAAATLSSAVGSILIAPRTMQALAIDNIFPGAATNSFLGRGKANTNDPVNATLVTSMIVLSVVALGSVDFVAQIISMFFMITYGTLCLVSFLEHFGGNPSYRPTFRSRWYISLIGALACFFMMFQMSPLYASISLLAIGLIYASIRKMRAGEDDLSEMLRGVLFQLNRKLSVLIQRKTSPTSLMRWRPSFIGISASSLTRLAPFDLLRWISNYYGFGTYIHFIKGPLNGENKELSLHTLERMIKLGVASQAGVFVDTIVSPSFETAVAQIIQIPGVSGMENNSILFEFHQDNPADIEDIIKGLKFADIVDFNICVLRSSERHFGFKRSIHIWLTPGDYRNANLMILLGYIIIGHREWKGATIDIFASYDERELKKQVGRLNTLIDQGRIPISHKNVQKIPWKQEEETFEALVSQHSEDADLVMVGFSLTKLKDEKGDFLSRFENIKDLIFVRAGQKIAITEAQEKQ